MLGFLIKSFTSLANDASVTWTFQTRVIKTESKLEGTSVVIWPNTPFLQILRLRLVRPTWIQIPVSKIPSLVLPPLHED